MLYNAYDRASDAAYNAYEYTTSQAACRSPFEWLRGGGRRPAGRDVSAARTARRGQAAWHAVSEARKSGRRRPRASDPSRAGTSEPWAPSGATRRSSPWPRAGTTSSRSGRRPLRPTQVQAGRVDDAVETPARRLHESQAQRANVWLADHVPHAPARPWS